jgi:hypothetical protein
MPIPILFLYALQRLHNSAELSTARILRRKVRERKLGARPCMHGVFLLLSYCRVVICRHVQSHRLSQIIATEPINEFLLLAWGGVGDKG